MKLFLLLLLVFTVSAENDHERCGSPSMFKSGESHARIARHIIGGNEVPMGKWSWQILLSTSFYIDFNGIRVEDGSACGGTVISDRWILTAAHCFRGEHKYAEVYSGITHGYQNETEQFSKEKKVLSVVEKFYKHPNYDFPLNDIALVKLQEPLKFDESVSPICLPRGNQSIPEDGQALIVGFGKNNVRGDDDSTILKADLHLRETSVPLIRLNRCKSRLLNTLPQLKNEINKLTSSHLCAGSFGHGASHGDSGGPLQMKSEDGRWFQLGITSFGNPSYKTARRQDVTPTVYTSVRKYCDWIKKTTKGEASCQEKTVTLKDVEFVV